MLPSSVLIEKIKENAKLKEENKELIDGLNTLYAATANVSYDRNSKQEDYENARILASNLLEKLGI